MRNILITLFAVLVLGTSSQQVGAQEVFLSAKEAAPAFALGKTHVLTYQTAGTYEDRAKLFEDQNFVGRIQVACVRVALEVAYEPSNTQDHAIRLKAAYLAVQEPEMVGRRVAMLVASSQEVVVGNDGPVLDMTDAELNSALKTYWTLISNAIAGNR